MNNLYLVVVHHNGRNLSNEYRKWYRDEYQQSEPWKIISAEKRKSVNYRCEKCNQQAKLDIHHKKYSSVGKESMSDLQALCRRCHEEKHQPSMKEIETKLAKWFNSK